MASHGSDTPTSPRAVLHHTEAILCTFMHTTVASSNYFSSSALCILHFDAFVRSFATQRSSALEAGGICKSNKRNGFLVPFTRIPISIFRNVMNKDFEISCQVLSQWATAQWQLSLILRPF